MLHRHPVRPAFPPHGHEPRPGRRPHRLYGQKPRLAHLLRRERPGDRSRDLAADPLRSLAKGQSGVGGSLLAGTFRSFYSDLRAALSPDDF